MLTRELIMEMFKESATRFPDILNPETDANKFFLGFTSGILYANSLSLEELNKFEKAIFQNKPEPNEEVDK